MLRPLHARQDNLRFGTSWKERQAMIKNTSTRKIEWHLVLSVCLLAVMLTIACVWFDMSMISAIVVGVLMAPTLFLLQRFRVRRR